jgi:hypothetical protein
VFGTLEVPIASKMFFFGDDPSLTANHYIQQAKKYGPKTPDTPLEEMGERDRVYTYITARVAYRQAKDDQIGELVLNALKEFMMEAFRSAVTVSDELVDAVKGKKFTPLGATKDEYLEIIKEVRHPSSADNG